MDISAPAISLPDRPQWAKWVINTRRGLIMESSRQCDDCFPFSREEQSDDMTKTVCALFAIAGFSVSAPAVAGNMGADEARRFVVGNLFSFTCFEGTTGEGRVNGRWFRWRCDSLGGQWVPTIRDTSGRNAASQGRRHLRADKRAPV